MESPESFPYDHESDKLETSFVELLMRARSADYGKEQILSWEELVGKTRYMNDDELLLDALVELGDAYTYGGELCQLPTSFQEARIIFETLNLDQQADWAPYLGKQYKYYLTALLDHPDTPVAVLHRELAELRDFWSAHASSMKEYYLRAYYVFRELGDESAAREAFSLWLAEPWEEGSFSECPSCSAIHHIKALYAMGDTFDAVSVGEQALSQTEDFCSAQPENLCLSMLEPWIYAGEVKKARRAHRRTLRRDLHSRIGTEFYSQHFMYYALMGMRGYKFQYHIGVMFFVSQLPYWLEMESPRILMDGAAAAAILLRHYPRPSRRLRLKFSGSSLPWIISTDLENPTVAEAAHWCVDIVEKLAHRFDSRPGLAHPHTVADMRRRIFDTEIPS